MSIGATSPVKISEAALQSHVVKLARLTGWLVHHTRPGMNRRGRWSTPIQGDAGYPDLTLTRGGHIIFIELKAQDGKLSAQQQDWRAALEAAGRANEHVTYLVVRPDDFDHLASVLSARRRRS